MDVEQACGGSEIMGTNYFLHAPACEHCGKEPEKPLHLGKSSTGWCFGLHVYPELGLDNWATLWSYIHYKTEEEYYEIKNEYGDAIDPALFFSIVWDRKGQPEKLFDKKWLADNHATIGPCGLARHALYPGHCIGHGGDGPFDYIVGDFE
jgi:hypothetical protein